MKLISTMFLFLMLAAAAAAAACEGEGMTGAEGDMFPPPGEPLRLLFIHHSCGGQLLADPGQKTGGESGSGERCIYVSHPNGGGLRSLLASVGYEVHELTYESRLGADTDIEHWRRKFADHMDDLLRVDRQDRLYADGRTNHIVVFKSCYPNNDFVGPGVEPGDPDSPERTVANAKAAYRSLLPLFQERPEVLFVAVTAPPRADPTAGGLKTRIKKWFGSEPKSADWAREFNSWLADKEAGWLADYKPGNVAVFDYYDILTGNGRGNWSAYPTGGGSDSHPDRNGNTTAARSFLPLLDEAVAGMRSQTAD